MKRNKLSDQRDIRFFPVFLGATLGVLLEIIATLIDEIITGNLFTDEVFASINLITPYTLFEVFVAYLVTVAAAALIVRARGAGDRIRMSELFSQTIIVCGLVGVGLTLIYVVFTPRLVRLVADDPAVYDNALAYFRAMRFYPLVDVFDTFMFAYVLYQGGYVHFYIAISARIGINAGLSWVLGSSVLPEAFDIDNEETFRLAGTKLMILAPSALFICLSRVTAIFYQYTRRIPRTIILFGTAIALLPSAFAMFFGRNAPEGIAVGIALGPVTALALIYGYVRFIKKETWRGSRW